MDGMDKYNPCPNLCRFASIAGLLSVMGHRIQPAQIWTWFILSMGYIGSVWIGSDFAGSLMRCLGSVW